MNDTTAHTPRKRHYVRWLIVGLLVVGCIAGSLVLLFKDEPPPDISDLILPPRHVRDEDNAYLALLVSATKLRDAEARDPEIARILENARRIEVGARGLRDRVTSLRSLLTSLTPSIEAALALPDLAAPRPYKIDDYSEDNYALHSLTCALLYDASAYDSAPTPGDTAREMSAAMACIRCQETAEVSLASWNAACDLREQARQILVGIVFTPRVDAHALATYQQALRDTRPSTQALEQALRLHVQQFLNSADYYRSNPISVDRRHYYMSRWMTLPARLEYDHNQTTRWIAEDLRATLPLLAKPGLTPTSVHTSRGRDYWFASIPNLHNYVGRKYSPEDVPLAALNRFRTLLAAHRVTEVWLALLRYQRAQAKLPASLSDLVPDYLDAVPVDPFDGAPLRYDSSLRAVWSIGAEGSYTPPVTLPKESFDLRVPEPAPHSP